MKMLNLQGFASIVMVCDDSICQQFHARGASYWLLDLHQLNAEYITSEIWTHISDAGYSADNILRQCYDGSSVWDKRWGTSSSAK